jgi:hypothetical protein
MTRRFTRRPSPGVYSVACDACDFGLLATPGRAFVLGPEGRRLHLPLPFWPDSVERETGRTWGEIVRTSAVVVELTGVCLGCGARNFIPADAVPKSGVLGADAPPCKSCGGRRFYPVVGDRVFEWPWKRRPPDGDDDVCPRCGRGRLTTRLWAII